MTRTVWFESSPRPFFVPKREPCHREVVDGLDVFEFRRRSRVAPYGLRMEARVANKKELEDRFSSALEIADDLDLVWTYVAGVPLFPRVLTMQLVKSPEGWRTNAARAKRDLPAGGDLYGKVRLVGRRRLSMELPSMPLKRALEAVKAYRKTDEVTRLLIGLHTGALKAPGSPTQLILLAKGLELARAILPGRRDIDRERALRDDELRSSLHHPLSWLYMIANRRLEIRHVVENPTAIRLHPTLTSSERKDFVHDGDVVIRGVIAERLGLEPVLVIE